MRHACSKLFDEYTGDIAPRDDLTIVILKSCAMCDYSRPPRRDRGGLPPTRKSLGQHFLTDKRILTRIADALHLAGGETVVEIGPGRGALTDILAERAGRLIAIEYDRALAEILRQRYAKRNNVLIAEADVLEVSLRENSQQGRTCWWATCRTTSRRRSSFTHWCRRVPSDPCISCSVKSPID